MRGRSENWIGNHAHDTRKVISLLLSSLAWMILSTLVAGCRDLAGGIKEVQKIELSPSPTAAPAPTAVTASPVEERPTILEMEEAPSLPMTPTSQPVVLKILYDNNPYNPELKTDWGFSVLVEYGEQTVLFDTGKNGSILLSNMRKMDVDPETIDAVVLSHAHADHIGGLQGVLGTGARPAIFLLPSFASSYKSQLRHRVEVIEARPGQEIAQGIFTTGEINGAPPEQALVLDTTEGLVVVTGCAHPGIVKMVQKAKKTFHDTPHLVVGGFHLDNKSKAQLQQILNDFHRLGVMHVAPCHCSGAKAQHLFSMDYGEGYIQAGAGKVIKIGP